MKRLINKLLCKWFGHDFVILKCGMEGYNKISLYLTICSKCLFVKKGEIKNDSE